MVTKQTKEEKVIGFNYALTAFQEAMKAHTKAMQTVQMCINRKKVFETNEQGLAKAEQQKNIGQLEVYRQQYQTESEGHMQKAVEHFENMRKLLK